MAVPMVLSLAGVAWAFILLLFFPLSRLFGVGGEVYWGVAGLASLVASLLTHGWVAQEVVRAWEALKIMGGDDGKQKLN